MVGEPTAVSRTVDVAVVGAGPAGSAAAITLAAAGRSVLVIDKAHFPRDKCCGDGLTTGALRLLERLGVDSAAMPSFTPVDTAWVRSPSGREVAFPFPSGRGLYGAVVPRRELDATLVARARAAGAEVCEGHELVAATAMGDAVRLTVVDGRGGDGSTVEPTTIEARAAIGADGMWSPLRKHLGLTPERYLGEWHAFRQYARGVTGPAAERLLVWFERDLLPGYAWSFPLRDGRVNLGFGVLRDGTRRIQDMAAVWKDLLQRPHVRAALGDDAELEDRHLAWPIPARVDRAIAGAGRALFAGDAVMATDPMTGEGIGQALCTGVLAAEAVLAVGVDDPAALVARYGADVRRALAADHRMSAVLGRVLSHDLGARGSVRVAGLTAWTRRNFARWLFEDEPRAIALTPSRWHRNFLDRDGAYADHTWATAAAAGDVVGSAP